MIKSFYYSSSDPIENLAYDDALLHEPSEHAYLRFWESPTYFVVLGHGNALHKEINVDECAKRQIPIYRRCSGGGTVLQGPGCLNYALILPTIEAPFNTISSTTCTILRKQANALRPLLPKIRVNGISDLCIDSLKFSGNAQRRIKNKLLFHGTFLYNFDLNAIHNLLAHPSIEPDYRNNRSHLDFITNISISKEQIMTALETEWISESINYIKNLNHLDSIQNNYKTKTWIEKF